MSEQNLANALNQTESEKQLPKLIDAMV
jgi:hypothetical protein